MLKKSRSLDEPAFSRNNSSRSASNRNNDSRPTYERNDSNDEVNRFSIGGNGMEYAKKSGKLFKSRKSKTIKMSKSWNLSKSGKKLSKNRNSTNSNVTKDGPKFLTSNARTAFNRLRLTFTKTPILWHFDLECHIWIETNTLDYAISGVLSQFISGTSPDKVITKTKLGQWHLVMFFLRKIFPTET